MGRGSVFLTFLKYIYNNIASELNPTISFQTAPLRSLNPTFPGDIEKLKCSAEGAQGHPEGYRTWIEGP